MGHHSAPRTASGVGRPGAGGWAAARGVREQNTDVCAKVRARVSTEATGRKQSHVPQDDGQTDKGWSVHTEEQDSAMTWLTEATTQMNPGGIRSMQRARRRRSHLTPSRCESLTKSQGPAEREDSSSSAGPWGRRGPGTSLTDPTHRGATCCNYKTHSMSFDPTAPAEISTTHLIFIVFINNENPTGSSHLCKANKWGAGKE